LKQLLAQRGVPWRAPDHVRAQVLAAISREAAMPARVPEPQGFGALEFVRRWLFVPSLAALAASLFLVVAPMTDRTSVSDEVVASHVRSLLVDHLTDVATSDQHTVKPWFNGRLDVAPPVVDLTAQGFTLIGGRLDYIDGKAVAAIVYRRRTHVINLFVAQGTASAQGAAERATVQGFNVEHWSTGGLAFFAVSDISPDELRDFIETFEAAHVP
jgi:anti-sigma factor RsiW